jgi:hypothetical protein
LKKALCIPLGFLLFAACNDAPVFPNEPEISFLNITPSVATQFNADEIQIKFHYQDGDGDLGYIGDPINNLFLEDMRSAFTTDSARFVAYSFASLTPQARKPSIQGEFALVLTTPPWEPNEEPLVFQIYIVDRAGNRSNTIRTSPIAVRQ